MNVEGGDPFRQAQEETFEIQIRELIGTRKSILLLLSQQ